MNKPEQDNRAAVERAVAGLAGAAFESVETVGSGISALWNFNKRVLHTVEQATEPLRKPFDALGVTQLVQRPVEAIAQNIEETVARLEDKGREGLAQTGLVTVEAIGGTVDAVIAYLTNNPAVEQLISAQLERVLPLLADNPAILELVRKQVAHILPALKNDPDIQELIRTQAAAYLATLGASLDPTLQALIRQQGDAYIDYLNAHPMAVKTLVQGQSMSLANEVMNEVRERTVTADSVAEMLVRKVLGRKQRTDLPPPPQEVQRRAETSRLPSDFFVDVTPDPQQPVLQLAVQETNQQSNQPRSNGHA